MIRGLYTSTTGMISQQKRMDVITNNLANATTPGFKQDQLLTSSFEELMIKRTGDSGSTNQADDFGSINNGIHIDEMITYFENGTLEQTNISTDFAVEGEGFFVVSTPSGERYTRAGSFTVSPAGNLTTQEGYEIQGSQGAIKVGNTSFSVDSDGTVTTSQGTDKMRLVTFDDVKGLRKEGNNLYFSKNANISEEAIGKINQGYLESSNVDLTKQMTDMIEVSRSFEINQRMIRMHDEKLGKAASEIGKL